MKGTFIKALSLTLLFPAFAFAMQHQVEGQPSDLVSASQVMAQQAATSTVATTPVVTTATQAAQSTSYWQSTKNGASKALNATVDASKAVYGWSLANPWKATGIGLSAIAASCGLWAAYRYFRPAKTANELKAARMQVEIELLEKVKKAVQDARKSAEDKNNKQPVSDVLPQFSITEKSLSELNALDQHTVLTLRQSVENFDAHKTSNSIFNGNQQQKTPGIIANFDCAIELLKASKASLETAKPSDSKAEDKKDEKSADKKATTSSSTASTTAASDERPWYKRAYGWVEDKAISAWETVTNNKLATAVSAASLVGLGFAAKYAYGKYYSVAPATTTPAVVAPAVAK